MLRSDRRTSAASRRCFRPSAPSWSASRTIIDASENSSYHPHIKMRACREVLGLVSVSYERGAEVSMCLLMRKITNETLGPHCCRSLVAFKISPNPDYHLITLTEMI